MRDKHGYDLHSFFYFFLWKKSVEKATPLKNIKLPIANTFHTRKSLFKPDGSNASKHAHTPIAQNRLISSEDLRFIILRMSGIFQKGRIIDATKAILSIINHLCYYEA